MPARTLEPVATFPNTGNLGLPIAQLAFGDTGLPVAVVNCIYVQRFSTYDDVAAGAVLVLTATFVVLCSLLI